MEKNIVRSNRLNFSALTSLAILITLFFGAQTQGATGQINISGRHQIIEGFGAANVWSSSTLQSLGNSNPAIYDVIFGDLGLDIVRTRNTWQYTGDSQYYIGRCKEVIADGRAQTGRPLKVMISAWSPGPTLKSNGGTEGGGTLAKSGGAYVYADYAAWWADSLEEWANSPYGLDADYINIQNEPDYNASWDTCRFEPTETADYAGYDQAFEAVHNEIYSRQGSNMPKMLVSDCTGQSRAGEYIDNIITPSQIYGYSHHLYNCNNGGNAGCGDEPDLYIDMMTNYASLYGDKPTIMTEYSDDAHVTAYSDCMDLAVLMHNSLVVESDSGYVYWQLAYSSGTGLVSITSSSWTINAIYYAMMHYSRFTDPNWQRVDASTNSSDLRISAYINPDNDELSVVIINTNASSSVSLDLSFLGFAVEDGDIYRTTSSSYCTLAGTYNGTGTLNIPANSITTLSLIGGPAGSQYTLTTSSTTGGNVTTPGEGSFNYAQDSNATIIATADQYYHFVNWTGTAVTAGKVENPNVASTKVHMDANYTVVANFAANPPDTTPPTPNPMTWASVPTATGSTTITMTASTATDANSPPVQYYFECTNHGEANSTWQSSPIYIASGLTPNTLYSFKVKARDSYTTPNVTGWSSTQSATTLMPSTDVNLIGSWTTGTTHAKVSGTDRALIFIAHCEEANTISLNSVTYGGQAMTKIIDTIVGTTTRAYVAAFILKEPNIAAATSTTFTPSWSTTPDAVGYSSAFFENVNQTTPVGATDSNTIASGTPTTIITDPLATNDGDMVILGATCGNSGLYGLNNNFIEGNDQTMNNTATGVSGRKPATGAAETPSATYSTGPNRQVIIGFVLRAAAGSPPVTYRTLTVTSSSGGTVTTPGTGSFNYPDGNTANIIASANANYHFVNWTGSAVTAGKVANPNLSSTTVLMDANYTVQANFTIDQQTLMTSATAGGTVNTPGIGTYWYNYGTNANIVASAIANYHFVNWTGSAVTAGKVANPNLSSTTVLMDANYAVQANFAIDQRALTTSASAGGTVTTPGIGTYWYDHGANVSIAAQANADYYFVNWTGTAVIAGKVADPNSAATTVLMDANYTVHANFEIDTAPAAPMNLEAEAGSGIVTLDWSDNSEADLAGYNIYRSITPGSGYVKQNVSLLSDSNFTDSSVINGTPYYYVVTAVDDANNESGYSNEVFVTPNYQNCPQVQAGGYRLKSDLNGDCYVNYEDLKTVADYWLNTDCGSYDNCGGADMDYDGILTFLDFNNFAEQWMQCNVPDEPGCIVNW